MYHIILILLLVGVVLELKDRKTPIKYFYAMFLLLTLMLSLRYGQGTDYFSYRLMYNKTPENFFKLFTYYGFQAEYGWRIIFWLFRLFGQPFPAFIFVLSIGEMALLFRFLQRFCKRRMLALFLSYHTLYLTWFFSGLRQGLVMAVFLGLLLEWLLQKKYLHYCVGCVLCGLIHSVGYLLLVAVIVDTKFLSALKWQLILVGAAWAAGLLISTGIFDGFLPKILPSSVVAYYNKKGLSLFAMAERILSYAVTVYTFWMCGGGKGETKRRMTRLLQIVTLGMIVYGGFVWLPLVASRLAVVFKMVEIAIWSSLLLKRDLLGKLKAAFCICLVLLMYTKNISSHIREGQYKDHVNVFNFPYVSVFDTKEITEYRSLDKKYEPLAAVQPDFME